MGMLQTYLRHVGVEPKIAERLCQSAVLATIQDILAGRIEYEIDCDTIPRIPEACLNEGFVIKSHTQQGKRRWDSKTITLHQDDIQSDCDIEGRKVLNAVRHLPLVNANVLDFLLQYPHLIPEKWFQSGPEIHRIYFFGTVYQLEKSTWTRAVRALVLTTAGYVGEERELIDIHTRCFHGSCAVWSAP